MGTKIKKQSNRTLKLLLVLFATVGFSNYSTAQSFEMINSFDIGFGVSSIEFINSPDSLNYQPLAVGVKNVNGPRWQSQGWINLHNPMDGKTLRHYPIGNYVNDFDYTSSYKGQEDNEFLAVAVDRNAQLIDMNSGEVTYLNNPNYNPTTSIIFMEDSLVILGDIEGSMLVFGTNRNANTHAIPIKSEIQRPNVGVPSPRSFAYNDNQIYSGMVNQVNSWTTPDSGSSWDLSFREKTSPTFNNIGRVNLVAYDETVQNGQNLYSADVDSLTVYGYKTGKKKYWFSMPDKPTSIAIGDRNFPFLAIGTLYDKVFIYDISHDKPALLGNFSNQNHTVQGISFGSYTDEDNKSQIIMATASTSGRIEIWEYIPKSSN
ncbi:MAG: hypothetical protein RIE52_06120 [Balneola sp.]|jgi:hypothetical protein